MSTIRYPLLHWLTTVVLGPALWLAYAFLIDPEPDAVPSWDIYAIALMFGAAFSLPTLLGYVVLYRWVRRSSMSDVMLKALCNILLIGCAGLSMAWLGGSLMPTFFFSYSAAIVLGSLPYRLNR